MRTSLGQTLVADPKTHVLVVAEELSAMAVDELRELKQWFERLGFGVEAYCCVRPPLSWLNSMVAQEVMGKKSGRLTQENAIAQFVQARGIVLPRLWTLQSVFPDLKCYPFSEAVQHARGPAGYFFETAALQFEGSYENLRENVGGSQHAVRLHAHINRHLGDRFARPGNDAFYSRLPGDHPELYAIPGERFALSASEAGVLQAMLEEENAWLRAQLGAAYCDEECAMADTLPVLDEARSYLAEALAKCPDPLSSLITSYLASHR